MKRTCKSLAAALLFSAGFVASAGAQSVTTTTVQEQPAVISEYLPDSSTIVVRAPESETPIRYRYTKTTTFTDPDGRVLSEQEIRSSRPATIYYSRVGDDLVASRVVVRPAAPVATPTVVEETTTTTTTRRVDD